MFSTIFITLISVVGVATISRVGFTSSVTIYNFTRQKLRKKKLKKKLKKSLETLNFNEFQNVIYEIKIYDSEYNKNLFTKLKKKYFFTNKTVENLNDFNRRFLDESNLINIIRNEIEYSLSRQEE